MTTPSFMRALTMGREPVEFVQQNPPTCAEWETWLKVRRQEAEYVNRTIEKLDLRSPFEIPRD